ncbi:AraC family transcriptional regulator [Oceanibacterium hippocampi]|uniref:HTH-type transcriptional repressor of iron proteins A n=1 Tax=Oceanibacterium hippocampi TaxID=745714 RepID=A0A1Y5RLV2_9PROT|nr:helix-turn-helix transcriptional regulator [Oceanibacterium hippocampi]SLN17875.1 HTH-type transcriptional repressor of iron proteins A [Oceanibacterium hippocampi]
MTREIGEIRHQPTFRDDVPRPVVALGSDYPDGYLIAPHSHRRGQLLYASTGVVVVTTPDGAWMMPPQRGIWIPPGTVHEVRMLGPVRMRSLYLDAEAARGMPDHCQALGVPPLMRTLLAEAVTLPREYAPAGRADAIMTLIQHEMRRLPPLPLSLPLPANAALARRCRAFVRQPRLHETIDDWSGDLGLSRRSFTRLFRRETGLSFVAWRQQACIMAALPRLAAGEPVTAVAIDLGYNNPAAFTTMFRRALGSSPGTYLEAKG